MTSFSLGGRFGLPLTILGVLAVVLSVAACGNDDDGNGPRDDAFVFSGGPAGGAYQDFAEALGAVMQDAGVGTVTAEPSDGSAQNLRRVHANEAQFGIVFAGDLSLGRAGQLTGDTTEYDQALPVAALYGGVIHLVVRADSDIESVDDLAGRTIAPGADGSGAAQAAERYFTHMGIWDAMNVEHFGYAEAAAALIAGEIDAFWVLAAIPNDAVITAAGDVGIRLLDTQTPAGEAGFFDAYPFYAPRVIPGGTYEDVPGDTLSIQDTAVWIANADVPASVVEAALRAVFSVEGLEQLRAAHDAAQETTTEDGLAGIVVPLHPGAQVFWEDMGIESPAAIAAE